MAVNVKIVMMEHLCCDYKKIIQKLLLLNIHIGYFSVVTPDSAVWPLDFLTGGHCDPHLKFLSGALDQSWLWQCVTLTRAGYEYDSMVAVYHWPELAVTVCHTDQSWLCQCVTLTRAGCDSVSRWPELTVTVCHTDQSWL